MSFSEQRTRKRRSSRQRSKLIVYASAALLLTAGAATAGGYIEKNLQEKQSNQTIAALKETLERTHNELALAKQARREADDALVKSESEMTSLREQIHHLEPPAQRPSDSNSSAPASHPPSAPTLRDTVELTQSDIENVINKERAVIQRTCWQPVLKANASDKSESARVMVAINIGTDGHVQSAVPTGGEEFGSLRSCIINRVRQWAFPRSNSMTSTSILFSFFTSP